MGEYEGSNKDIARRLLEGFWSTGHPALADELFTADFVHHRAPEGTPPGPEGQKQFVAAVRGYFPDLMFHVDDLIAEDERVVARWTAQFTNKDGQIVDYPGVDILRITNGMISELWSFFWFPEATSE